MTKLDELFQSISKKHVYVQTHNYPDQDALACAAGLQALLQEGQIESTIIYNGIIDKDNTLKMIELLHLDVHPVGEVALRKEDEIILVDGQKGNNNMSDFTGDEIACIDHHKPQDTSCYRFFDIRDDVGACASIIAGYFVENHISIPKEIATALVYGQKMDTGQFSRCVSPLDLDMFCYLYKSANTGILRILDTSSLKVSDLTAYRQAISGLKIYGNVGIADLGAGCSEAILGSISDFLLTLSDLEFTLVYSRRAGGLKFSVRSSMETVDASEIIREALSDFGDGGGHADMAAGFIPNISEAKTAEQIARQVSERVVYLVGQRCRRPSA